MGTAQFEDGESGSPNGSTTASKGFLVAVRVSCGSNTSPEF
jgi:hypothetical protein